MVLGLGFRGCGSVSCGRSRCRFLFSGMRLDAWGRLVLGLISWAFVGCIAALAAQLAFVSILSR